jgi:hypothetical protein
MNYPPGTPGPRQSLGEVRCRSCWEITWVTATTDLGMTYWQPEECSHCGAPWPADAELDPYEPDPDELRDKQLDREDDERRYEL